MNPTLTIETSDGEQFIAGVEDFKLVRDMQELDSGVSVEHEEHRFEVDTLINVNTGEEY